MKIGNFGRHFETVIFFFFFCLNMVAFSVVFLTTFHRVSGFLREGPMETPPLAPTGGKYLGHVSVKLSIDIQHDRKC